MMRNKPIPDMEEIALRLNTMYVFELPALIRSTTDPTVRGSLRHHRRRVGDTLRMVKPHAAVAKRARLAREKQEASA